MKDSFFIGIDLGDMYNYACILDYNGNEIACTKFRNTKDACVKFAGKFNNAIVAIEACVHSPWVSTIFEMAGIEVYVANPRKLRCIWDADDKTDLRDARMLARLVRVDTKLLYPIKHRSHDAQADLQIIRARDALVEARTALVNSVRSGLKVLGERLPGGWSTRSFARKAAEYLSPELLIIYRSVLDSIQKLSDEINAYDKAVAKLNKTKYVEAAKLEAVNGVGPITALSFILTIEDASRFRKSRDVGPYLGLVPRRDQSGESDKQLRITKAGNKYLRNLLVGSAQYILGPFGQDCQLRVHGLKIAARGGKNAKKRAVVAVARKLAILLHRLWVSNEEYAPFYGSNAA